VNSCSLAEDAGGAALRVYLPHPKRRGPPPIVNKVFAHEVHVQTADCDPAGIVFYPQFLVMTDGTKDQWFARGLGHPRLELLHKRRLHVEPESVSCAFSLPVRMGEALKFELSVLEIHDASVRIRIVGKRHTVEHLSITQAFAFVSLDTRRAVPIPGDLRPRIEEYLVEPETARQQG
jgi:4-hydroxybenzoyl-CoA thioesterase